MNPAADPEFLGRLLSEQGGALALYAAQWTDAAEDCVQEALVELVRQPELPDNVPAWLFRVVRNRAISRARATQRRKRHESRAAEHHPSLVMRAAESEFTADELEAALSKLAGDLREVVVARIWGGLGFEKIAELIGASVSTAHRRYEAGLVALRERLEPAWITEKANHR
jgi:RNA polymerase sigma-70 factor (ECF subfamily)